MTTTTNVMIHTYADTLISCERKNNAIRPYFVLGVGTHTLFNGAEELLRLDNAISDLVTGVRLEKAVLDVGCSY